MVKKFVLFLNCAFFHVIFALTLTANSTFQSSVISALNRRVSLLLRSTAKILISEPANRGKDKKLISIALVNYVFFDVTFVLTNLLEISHFSRR